MDCLWKWLNRMPIFDTTQTSSNLLTGSFNFTHKRIALFSEFQFWFLLLTMFTKCVHAGLVASTWLKVERTWLEVVMQVYFSMLLVRGWMPRFLLGKSLLSPFVLAHTVRGRVCGQIMRKSWGMRECMKLCFL